MNTTGKVMAIAAAALIAVLMFSVYASADGISKGRPDMSVMDPYNISDGFSYNAKVEHVVGDDLFDLEFGTSYAVTSNFIVNGAVLASDDPANSLDITSYKVGAEYHISSYAKLYADHYINPGFSFDEDKTVLGASLNF
tara:strand:+ start:121 stop:537 length:417 start_codon:yes stop_codon:yes gene_type:complete